MLSGLFEPFCIEGAVTGEALAGLLAKKGIFPLYLTPLGGAKHIFTHIEWHMTGFEVILPEEAAPLLTTLDPALFLAPRERIDRAFALPSAYRAYRPYM